MGTVGDVAATKVLIVCSPLLFPFTIHNSSGSASLQQENGNLIDKKPTVVFVLGKHFVLRVYFSFSLLCLFFLPL